MTTPFGIEPVLPLIPITQENLDLHPSSGLASTTAEAKRRETRRSEIISPKARQQRLLARATSDKLGLDLAMRRLGM